jgi:hypothetical protein
MYVCEAVQILSVVTGQSVMNNLHFMKKIPIDWYSKKQARVERATYNSQ